MTISFNTAWVGNMIWDGIIVPNSWNATVQFDFQTNDSYIQYITVERLRYFFDDILNGSIFCNIESPMLTYLHKKTKNHVITLPAEPSDHLLGAAILSKIICFGDNNIDVIGIDIGSEMNSEVNVYIDSENLADAYPILVDNPIKKLTSKDGWWLRDDCSSTDIVIQTKNKIDVFMDTLPWDSIDLSWEEPREQQDVPESNNVLKKGWKPRVIIGGQHK